MLLLHTRYVQLSMKSSASKNLGGWLKKFVSAFVTSFVICRKEDKITKKTKKTTKRNSVKG
jgi:hypothetical protein